MLLTRKYRDIGDNSQPFSRCKCVFKIYLIFHASFRVIVVLLYHLVISLNHEWLEPRLRMYERQRRVRQEREQEIAR